MSKLSKAVKKMKENQKLRKEETVINFMGGDSYVINPLDTLKMISASSIFGEPSYYRDSKSSSKSSSKYLIDSKIKEFSIIPDRYENKTTDEIFTDAIDAALDYDFDATLKWALQLRNEFYMRLNPQVIMVRAAIHPKRKEWTEKNPGLFNVYNKQIACRADDSMSQMSYYLYIKGNKNNIPSILKKSWASILSNLDEYAINKYKNHEIGMINAVRLCHANSKYIDELMRTGTIQVNNSKKTWEQYRSEGKSWEWILQNITMNHMALLRNIRGVFCEINNLDICKKYMEDLKAGVIEGKQFPFRYWSAIKAVENSVCNHKSLIIDTLEECMDIALENYPKLKGKTMCLSDNSGSAWGTFNSEYGSVTVAEIDNLSSVITAVCSEDGYVGKFGNKLNIIPISLAA